MKVDDDTLVFVQGKVTCIDVCLPDGRGEYSRETLDEIRKRYPGAECVKLGPWVDAKEQSLCSKPEEIAEEKWIEMLEVLPPQNWKHSKRGESFELCEHTSGRITGIYVRLGGKFYAFQGLAWKPLEYNLALVEQSLK